MSLQPLEGEGVVRGGFQDCRIMFALGRSADERLACA